MGDWRPITEREFLELLAQQYLQLTDDEKECFDCIRVPPRLVTIRRPVASHNEKVFVVAEGNRLALYFDDVEFGFNCSPLDPTGGIAEPRGNQFTLQDALNFYFPNPQNRAK